MAGLIDTSIIRPELAGSFAAGYRGAEQARQQAQQLQQQNEMGQQRLAQERQQLEITRDKFEQLKQDRAILTDLQTKMKAAGQSDDPRVFFRAMIQTGNPDYMSKGYEGLQRYDELRRNEAILRQFAPEMFPPPAGAPTAAPVAAAPMAEPFGAPIAAPVTTGAPIAAPAAAPVNAMAPTSATGAPDVNALRQQLFALSSVNDPRAKALAKVVEAQIAEVIKPITLGSGQRVYRGGRVEYTAPDKPAELPTSVRETNAYLSMTPAEQAAFDRIKKLGATNVTSTVTNVQEKAEKGKYGELLVKQFDDISNTAKAATKSLPAIETQAKILNEGFTTGFGTEAKKAAASVLSALGVSGAEKFASNAQTFLAATNQAVLQKQLEQKGTQTKADAERIETTGAQLGNTVNANKFIIDVAKAQLDRDIAQRNFYANWRKKTGSFDDAEEAWYAGEGGKSLFDRPELKKYATPGAAASQIPGNAPAARPSTSAAQPMFARNPQTNQRIMSVDGGNTWVPAR